VSCVAHKFCWVFHSNKKSERNIEKERKRLCGLSANSRSQNITQQCSCTTTTSTISLNLYLNEHFQTLLWGWVGSPKSKLWELLNSEDTLQAGCLRSCQATNSIQELWTVRLQLYCKQIKQTTVGATSCSTICLLRWQYTQVHRTADEQYRCLSAVKRPSNKNKNHQRYFSSQTDFSFSFYTVLKKIFKQLPFHIVYVQF